MAYSYENYQIPHDFNQVNLFDHNYYHHNHRNQQFGFDPTSYNCYNWNESESESESESETTSASVAYSGFDPTSYNCYKWNESESETTSVSVAYSGFDPTIYNCYNWNESESETTSASVAYSGFDPTSYNFYNWNGSESETTSASVAYSVSTMSEPKHLFYDPNLYTTYESPPQYKIYCSVASALDFNEPEFEEYDPTPYGGGYDIVATYGKPVFPSVETCYPSSTAPHAEAPSPPQIIAPVPLGIYDGGQQNVVRKRVTFAEPVVEAKPVETSIEEEDEEYNEEEEDEEHEEDQEDEDEEEDHGSSYGTEKSVVVEKEEVKALYVPSGYGLEATDLCEVIFGGYFPCVLRNKRRQEDDDRAEAVSCWESNDSDPWKTTSDYLFGDSYPYGNENRSERSQY